MPIIVNSGALGWYAEDWFQKRGKNLLPRITPKMDEDITMCFQIFDEDGSGTVEIGEVRQAIDMLGIRYTYKQLDELFAKFDSNGDQEFDIYEFKMLMVHQLIYSGSNNSKGPEGGDPSKPTTKVDINTIKQTLQRRNILGKVFANEEDTLGMLCTLKNNGLKVVHAQNAASRERFLAPPKVPIPFQHRSRRRNNFSITAFTHSVSSEK